MEPLLLQHFDYQQTTLRRFVEELKRLKIEILPGYFANIVNVQKFLERYVFPHEHKVALCGIAPGRNGAGKTGVPFVDFSFLSKLMGEHLGDEEERSSQFFAKVVERFGAEKFYTHIYVTNLSTFGFCKEGKNLNYYGLPSNIQEEILHWFDAEMKIMNIKQIIPCSKRVHTALLARKSSLISCKICERLPHPNWCAFPKRTAAALDEYSKVLQEFIPNT